MKKFLLILTCYLGFISMPQAEQQIIEAGGFVHSVFFWLNNPQNADERAEFEAHLSKFINASAYVKSKHIGVSAKSDRDVVDTSYDYNLIVTFADKDAQDKYQTEPVHIDFVNNASHLWKKVVVYDAHSIL